MSKTFEIIPLLALPRNSAQHYSYLPPVNTAISRGDLVKIPFANAQTEGLVLGHSNSKLTKLKTVQHILVKQLASETDLRWLMEYANTSYEPLSLMAKVFTSTRRQLTGYKGGYSGLPKARFKTRCEGDETKIEKFIHGIVDGQILILIPESTYATHIENLCRRINSKYIIYNNKLRESEKNATSLLLAKKEPCVVIAPHSGIFLPLSRLRGIIIWEPALTAHRQWDKHPRYDARIGAYLRARNENIPLVFYSTIPSSNLFAIFPKFYEKTQKNLPPLVQLNSLSRAREMFPDEIIRQINKQLERKRKVLIFHDGLGFESTYLCDDCGIILRCDICGGTLQRNLNNLFCGVCKHHAGNLRAFCPRCGSPKINALKTGTRALQLQLQRKFPDTTIMRIDREEKKKSLEIILNEAQIIVATQKIFSYANQLKFDFCYVPNSETLFNSNSYDAQERGIITIYRLLDQLNNDGQSCLFVKNPYGESKILRAFAENKQLDLIKNDLADRMSLQFPPYNNINYFAKSFSSLDLATKEIKSIVKKTRSLSPKSIIRWQIIKKQNEIVGRISLRGNLKDLRETTKFVPNNWNIDPYAFLSAR